MAIVVVAVVVIGGIVICSVSVKGTKGMLLHIIRRNTTEKLPPFKMSVTEHFVSAETVLEKK